MQPNSFNTQLLIHTIIVIICHTPSTINSDSVHFLIQIITSLGLSLTKTSLSSITAFFYHLKNLQYLYMYICLEIIIILITYELTPILPKVGNYLVITLLLYLVLLFDALAFCTTYYTAIFPMMEFFLTSICLL